MLKVFNEYKGLPKEVYVLFTANVINRFGDFVSPLLALYLTQKLAMDTKTSSAIVTIALLSRMPGSFIGGRLADKWGRKRIYLITQTIAGLTLLPCAFLQNHFLVIVLLIVSTFFNGAVRPALDALALDLMPHSKRKLGISLMYLGVNVGVAVGPALAGYLFKINLPLFFLVDVLTSLIAVALVFTLISNSFIDRMHAADSLKNVSAVSGNTYHLLLNNKNLFYFMIIASGFSMIYVQTKFSLPLLFSHEFGMNGSGLLGILFSVNAITVIVFTSFITLKTQMHRTSTNVILGGLFYAFGFGLYGFVKGFILYIAATIIWTFGEILMSTNIKAYIADHTPVDFRGRINALYQILKAGQNALGVVLSGWLIPVVGYSHIWILILAVSLFLTILIGLNSKHGIQKSAREQTDKHIKTGS